jgi:hypothetical protein
MTLDGVWGSRGNTPASAETAMWIRQLLDGLRGARRRRVAFLVWTFAVLAAITALVGMTALVKPSELTSAPAVVVLLATQWATFGFILRQALQAGALHPFRGATIRESLELLHREAGDTARRTAVILGLFAVAFPTLWAAIAQLRAAGKMAPHEASSAAVVLTGVLAIAASGFIFRRYRVALPRRARLEALLRQHREG